MYVVVFKQQICPIKSFKNIYFRVDVNNKHIRPDGISSNIERLRASTDIQRVRWTAGSAGRYAVSWRVYPASWSVWIDTTAI